MFNFTTYSKSDVAKMLKAADNITKEIRPTKTTKAQKKLLEVSKYIYILKNISSEDIIKITKDVSFKEFSEGEIVFEDGEKSDEIYFLVRGELIVEMKKNDKYKKIAQIKPLELFGEMAFISKKPRNARIKSSKDGSTIIKFIIDEAEHDTSTCHAFTKVYKNIAVVIVKKLESSNELLVKN